MTTMNELNLVLLVGASQGLLLAALLVALRSANAAANRFLAVFVGFEALHLLWLFLIYTSIEQGPPALLRLLFSFRALGTPCLFLYVCTMTAGQFTLRRHHWLHLLVLLPTLVWWSYLMWDGQWLQQTVYELQRLPSTIWLTIYMSLLVIGYGSVALHRLNRHMRRLEQALSATETVSLWWLRAIIAMMVAANALALVLDLLRLQQMIGPDIRIWINIVTTLLVIYLIAFGGLRQSSIFSGSVREALAALDDAEHSGGDGVPEGGNDKYRKSGLDKARLDALWTELKALLAREPLYQDTSLDLPTLARRLGVRPQELSQVINTASDGSFYDLINSCRVEAAKQLLANPLERERKLFDIAISVGFSSQSTFYSHFKKKTGTTPSAYRKRLQAGADDR